MGVQVTDRNNVETAFKHVLEQFSRPPTVIVNSAGITRDNFLIKLSDNNFDDVINVNLKGTFLVMQTAVKAMIEANATKDSSIINISSIVGKNGNIGQSNYSASKAGVVAMTKSASMEFGQYVLDIYIYITLFKIYKFLNEEINILHFLQIWYSSERSTAWVYRYFYDYDYTG